MMSVQHITSQHMSEQFLLGACGEVSDEELEACLRFINLSPHTWLCYIDGEVVGAWGLIPGSLLSNDAFLWLHTTSKLNDHVFMFIRRSQIVMKEMLEIYSHITGHCEIGNKKAQKWIEWCGGKFDPEPIGDLLQFHIRKSNG